MDEKGTKPYLLHLVTFCNIVLNTIVHFYEGVMMTQRPVVHRWPVIHDSNKGPVLRSYAVFIVIGLNKLLHKQSRCCDLRNRDTPITLLQSDYFLVDDKQGCNRAARIPSRLNWLASFNSSPSSAAYMRQWPGSALVQIMPTIVPWNLAMYK